MKNSINEVIGLDAEPIGIKKRPIIGDNGSQLLMGEVFSREVVSANLPAAHWISTNRTYRKSIYNRGRQLNEAGQPPIRNPLSCYNSNGQALLDIVNWLEVDVEVEGVLKSARYKKAPPKTFCNIYAYDYCTFAGAYLPRIWWTPSSITKLKNGENVQVNYKIDGSGTVRGMEANDLFNWLIEFGSQFFWTELMRTSDFTVIQNWVNAGNVVVLVQNNPNTGGSGHILMVIPESAKRAAVRSGGKVVVPVHSQAGSVNFAYNELSASSPKNKKSLFDAFAQNNPNVKMYGNQILC